MPDHATLEYPFRANRRSMTLAIAFFGVCGAAMLYAAATNDRGLIINGLITLGVTGATRFYIGMAVASLAFVAFGAAGLASGRGQQRVVRLTSTSVEAPKNGFAREPIVVPLSQIQGVGVQEIYRQRILAIQHSGGTLNIVQQMLPSPAAFDELASTLIARLRERESPAGHAPGASPHRPA